MEWMDVCGQTIYLKVPVPVLVERLQAETMHRPLIAGKSKEELTLFIEKKLAERAYYYEQAQIIVEYQGEDIGLEELLLKQGPFLM